MSLVFSIEMDSKHSMKKIALNDTGHEKVLLEGDLGSQDEIIVTGSEMVEISGSNGTLRLALQVEHLRKALAVIDESKKKEGKK